MRHFLTISDLSEFELRSLLREAARFKRNRLYARQALKGNTVALVFQKPSMRTRVAFEVAVCQLGGSVITLGQDEIRLGERESIKDVARVLSSYVDAVVFRTFAHEGMLEFARYSRIPVINGLSDLVHPCQALADLLTIQEHFGRLKGLRLSYVGDGNNVLYSLAQGAAMMGMSVSVGAPKRYQPNGAIWKEAARTARRYGASVSCVADPKRAVQGADVIYTDVWVSMGQEKERLKRQKIFRSYQVNRQLLNSARAGACVMHCLPAHRGDEITDEVMDGKQSLIFHQAENRLHVQKALLMFLLRGRRGKRNS